MPRGAQLLQVVPQLLGARGMAELAQGLDLDLADALAGHAKALADLFQGALVTVDEPKAELEHAPLAWDKGSERGLDRKLEHGDRGDVQGDVASLSSTKSPSWESSSWPIGVSSEIGACANLMTSRTRSRVRPISSAISSSVGSRPRTSSMRRETRASLLMISPMWTGMRIVRAWSAMARVTACRIHQVA